MARYTLAGTARSRGLSQVNPRLVQILEAAAARSPYQVQIFSGKRTGSAGGSRHNTGNALDIALIDPTTGQPIPNYKSSTGFPIYAEFAKVAREEQMRLYPDMADSFRWGGGFSDKDFDLMHFDSKPGGAMRYWTWQDGGKLTAAGAEAVPKFGAGWIYANGEKYRAPPGQYASLWGNAPYQGPEDAPTALASLTAPEGGTEVPGAPVGSSVQGFVPDIPDVSATPAQQAITQAITPQPRGPAPVSQPLQLPPQWDPAAGFPPPPPRRPGPGGPLGVDLGLQPAGMPVPPSRPNNMPLPPSRPGTFDWMGGGAPDAGAVPTPGISPLRPAFGGPGDRRPQPPMPQLRPAFGIPDPRMRPSAQQPLQPPGLTGGLVGGRPEYPGQMPAAPFQTPYGGPPPIAGASPGGMPAAPPAYDPLSSASPGLTGGMNLPPPPTFDQRLSESDSRLLAGDIGRTRGMMERSMAPLPSFDDGGAASRGLARELGFNRRQMEGYTRPPSETLAMGPHEEAISAPPPATVRPMPSYPLQFGAGGWQNASAMPLGSEGDAYARAYGTQLAIPANWGDPSSIPITQRFEEAVGPTQATERTFVRGPGQPPPMKITSPVQDADVANQTTTVPPPLAASTAPRDPQVAQAQTQPRSPNGRFADQNRGGFAQRMLQGFIPGGSFLGPNAVFGLGNAGKFTPSGAFGTSPFNQQLNGSMGTTNWRQGSVTGNPAMSGVMWNRSGNNGSVGYVTSPFTGDVPIYSGSPNRF